MRKNDLKTAIEKAMAGDDGIVYDLVDSPSGYHLKIMYPYFGPKELRFHVTENKSNTFGLIVTRFSDDSELSHVRDIYCRILARLIYSYRRN